MKPRWILLACFLPVTLWLGIAQQNAPNPFPDDARWNAIVAKHKAGEKITEEERDYYESKLEHKNQAESAQRNADWSKSHPARESTGLIPLPDLGKGMYEGEQGGLYPGGVNKPPKAHLDAGLKLAKQIVPLDAQGQPSPDGRIVLCTIGMSNTTQESRSFLKLAVADTSLNPKLTLVDCAQGSMTASKIQDPKHPYWQTVAARIRDAGVTAKQVQVVWMKEANGNPTDDPMAYAKALYQQQIVVLHNLHDKFPNLKIAYVSNRIYGGWVQSPLNPEPYAYAGGFSTKWLIADQIAGKSELNYDPAKGQVVAPWIAWGPYLWADGLKGRKQDGLVWKREDVGPDGTHPSMLGREKVAHLLMDFLKSDPTSKSWFLPPA